MLTENGLQVDLEAVERVLDQADVLAIGFTLFPERLLIDARSQGEEGPLVAVVEPVGTVQERYLWLGKHRPNFGAPEAFAFFVWPHTVRNLVERDALRTMRNRLAAARPEAAAALDAALDELLELERRAFIEAVAGSPRWQTLWEASRLPRNEI
jgi:predicted dienelactone hydrolase